MSDKLKFVARFRYQLLLPARNKPKFVGHFHGVGRENSQKQPATDPPRLEGPMAGYWTLV